ncbi:MAG: SDR family NAD(P)-dependent oxidoreductase [Dehalococcoidia bacterium]
MSSTPAFADQVAIVTGGASGIGRAICQRLSEGGATVAAVDQNRGGAEETLTLLDGPGAAGSAAFEADVSESADVQRVVSSVREQLGAPAILVNNAAISRMGRVWELSEEDWERVMAVNLRSVFLFCKEVAPLMVEREYGRIVNISSGTAVRVGPGTGPYAASKAGVIAITKSVAGEVARWGITANAVAPGLVNTAMTRGHFGSEEALTEWAKNSSIANPMRVVLEPQDIAAAVAFLCLPEARYITGQTLHVNAGSYMP